ncbi:nuclear transport factor 2 family protein [Conexibacter sp. JD483]|uniref:ester cyclase n=1 Tax=unclassified Conexibacter TaxID=2627773 RepID=UPI00271D72A5|nr:MULTISPECIES: nuclear transport factor 2 family protein [unclassified Conexibacter]MDO8187545.1 nuclear transport factor 2 family protein [Conexibacter sp. CPCC 205706]MDO8199212.1 nuclear transport factor 2 family protein [Conexibacter sp. CPCC 205762]MDR9372790.1 nuclear transport factor 2 family protein [Conexibacter sp. JD483]
MAGTGDVVKQHIEAFNARDVAGEPWAADAEMTAPGASVSGRDAVLGFLGVFHEAFSDGRLVIQKLIVDGASAAAEGRFVGTHDGVLHTPNGDVPATGRAIDFRWAAAYEVNGEELLSEHLYFDQQEFLTQLGLV